MGVKTVLDFPEVTTPEDADVIYAIRGTSAGRDKRITWANLKQFLAPLAHAASTAIYGQGTSAAFGHVKVDDSPTHLSTNAVSSGGTFSAIGDEALARENADDDITETLGGQISAEATARANADSAEVTARTNADNALQGQITTNAADIAKLWAPTSSSQQDVGSPGTDLSNTEIVDGACVTVYPTFTGIFQLTIGTPPEGVKVFHVRLKLPTADTDYEQKLRLYYASALDANATVMTQYVQKREADNAGYVQYSPVFTFVASGAGWILM